MLSEEQISRIIAENELLHVQLQDLELILSLREEEILHLKGEAAAAAELRSQMEQQLDEMQSMQNHIGQKQREAEGAAERELELELELTESAKLLQQYNQLLQQYAYTQAQLEDIRAHLAELKTRNLLLQQIVGKVGEIESHLANTVMERDGLMTRITLLEKAQFRHET